MIYLESRNYDKGFPPLKKKEEEKIQGKDGVKWGVHQGVDF